MQQQLLDTSSRRVRFNSDILLDDQGVEDARKKYSQVFFALNNEGLKEDFRPRDDDAKLAKARSQRWGLAAVALVTLALIIASAEPLYQEAAKSWLGMIAGLSALLGVVGGAIGAAGVRYGERKHKWLVNRLICERLRQFHFQTLILFAPEIAKAAGDPDAEQRFLDKRAALLGEFRARYLEKAEAKLTAIVEERASDDVWLIPPPEPRGEFKGPAADELLMALEELRLIMQRDYAEDKLSANPHLISSKPKRQAAVLGAIALICVVGLVMLHAAMLVNIATVVDGAHAADMTRSHVLVIALAVVALAVRTVEEGLAPRAEVERYRQYDVVLRQLQQRFRAADGAGKLVVLRDLEAATYHDMVNFLKSSNEVRFMV